MAHANDVPARMNETTCRKGVVSLGCIHLDFEDYKAELAPDAAGSSQADGVLDVKCLTFRDMEKF